MKQLLFLSFFISSVATAQNLIPNSGFEDHTGCPSTYFQFYQVNNWFNPTTNIPGITGTPDYYNSCATIADYDVPGTGNYHYQFTHAGDAYAGIWAYYSNNLFPEFREYLSAQLLNPLIEGECYQFQMYVNLSNGSNINTSSIGAYFSDTLINSIDSCLHFPFSPQIINPITNYPDTSNWMLVEGTYVAHGGESYIIIGNFSDNANSSLIHLDTLSYGSAYFYIDDVSLNVTSCTGIDEVHRKSELLISPNPFGDFINLDSNEPIEEVALTDITGQTILCKNYVQQNESRETLTLISQSRGVYVLKIKTKNNYYTRKITKV